MNVGHFSGITHKALDSHGLECNNQQASTRLGRHTSHSQEHETWSRYAVIKITAPINNGVNSNLSPKISFWILLHSINIPKIKNFLDHTLINYPNQSTLHVSQGLHIMRYWQAIKERYHPNGWKTIWERKSPLHFSLGANYIAVSLA